MLLCPRDTGAFLEIEAGGCSKVFDFILLYMYTAKNPQGVSGPLHVRYRTFTTS